MLLPGAMSNRFLFRSRWLELLPNQGTFKKVVSALIGFIFSGQSIKDFVLIDMINACVPKPTHHIAFNSRTDVHIREIRFGCQLFHFHQRFGPKMRKCIFGTVACRGFWIFKVVNICRQGQVSRISDQVNEFYIIFATYSEYLIV